MSAFAGYTSSAAVSFGSGSDDLAVAMDDTPSVAPVSRYAQLQLQHQQQQSQAATAAASLIGLAHTQSLVGPSAVAGETFHDAADALLFGGQSSSATSASAYAYDPIANGSYLGAFAVADPLQHLQLQLQPGAPVAPAQQPAAPPAIRVKTEPLSVSLTAPAVAGPPVPALNFNALNYNYNPTQYAAVAGTGASSPLPLPAASPTHVGVGNLNAVSQPFTPQQRQVNANANANALAQLQLLQQQLALATPASVYASGALNAYGNPYAAAYSAAGAAAPALSVEFLLSPPQPHGSLQLMSESPDSVAAAMSPASPVPLQLAAAAALHAAEASGVPVAVKSSKAQKKVAILPRPRAAAAAAAAAASHVTYSPSTDHTLVTGSRPSRPAKVKANQTLERLSHADAKGDSSPSASDSESPKPRHAHAHAHSHSHSHKSSPAVAGRKRKVESDDDFELSGDGAPATPDTSDLSDADAASVATEASEPVVFAAAADADAEPQPPRKRAKKSAAAHARAAAAADTAVVPAGVGAGSELTAAFIRSQLIAQVKALQQRINAGIATDPRTELENLRNVLGAYQFSSCSGTMAIYGLSFPHAGSAIPAPKVANASAQPHAHPALAAPQPSRGALALMPPLAIDSLLPFPTFAPTAAPAYAAPAVAEVDAGAGAGAGGAELDLHTFELMRVTHGSQMVFVNVQVAPNETIRFSLKVNKHLISRAPTSAYFESRGFVVPSLVPHSSSQVRVSQVHRGTAQPLLCVVGGEVRHARLKSAAELAKLAAKQAAAAAAGVDADAEADDFDDADAHAADEKGVSRQHKKSVAAAKKDKDTNNGRPLKCNLICQAGIPIRFAVYCRRGFTPAMWASTKLRKLSDSRLIATNDDFKFKLIA